MWVRNKSVSWICQDVVDVPRQLL